MKEFLDYPPCPDIEFNPHTCPDCGVLTPNHYRRCQSCHDNRVAQMLEACRIDVAKYCPKSEPSLPDATYYWIVYIIAGLLSLGYLYVATR